MLAGLSKLPCELPANKGFHTDVLHLDALEIEVILPSKFLNLDCVDHLLERILKTQHEQKHNG